jgi:hypothetical protein
VKALPACDPEREGFAFDGEPPSCGSSALPVPRGAAREGELTLRESPFDPVADLPVRRLVRMEYEEGTTESDGRVLRSLPAGWVLPYFHQRYDDPRAEGIEV